MNAPGPFGGGPRALRRLANQIPQEVEPMHIGEHWSAPPPHRSQRWEEPVALLELRKSSAPAGTALGGAVLRSTGVFPGGGTLPQQTQRRPRFAGERVRMPDVFRKVNP